MTRRRIVVLGAGGYIGRRIVASMATDPAAEPIAAVRRSVRGAPAAVEQRIVDATSAPALAAALADADGVINCVVGSGSVIVDSARALAQVLPALERRPRLVHLSTMSVYGRAHGRVDESAALTAPAGEYGQAKREAEALLAVWPGTVLLRPGIVYGSGSPLWSRLIGELLLARRLGDLGAAGAGICNLVHVDDVAAAAVSALSVQAAAGRAYNLVVDTPPTWNGYFAAFARALELPAVPTISPLRLAMELRVVGPLLKLGEKLGLSGLPPAIRPWLIDQCSDDLCLDGTRAANELGLRQRLLESGLAETARWLRAALKA